MSGSNLVQRPSSEVQTQASSKIKILAFCDSPTVTTGFGRVAKNVLGRWQGQEISKFNFKLPTSKADPSPQSIPLEGAWEKIEVHCWGINFNGWHYDQVPYLIMPAGGHDWNSPAKLSQFLNVLNQGDYTHVWMMMDPDMLNVGGFPQKLRQVCKEKGIRTMLYYPVDAPLEYEWLGILHAVDVAVAYTEYGRAETRKALGKSLYPIEVVPHGVDECFRPISVENRLAARDVELELADASGKKSKTIHFVQPDTFLMLNVNKNEWRKDPLRSLEILKAVRSMGVPAKLILRMDPNSAMGGVQLDLAAKQLGLTYGEEWCYLGPVTDDQLVGLYNAADLYLTTSMGEGWGLGVTEAMACHCPVAMAMHTSLKEIGVAQETSESIGCRVLWLSQEESWVCGADTRLRARVELKEAALNIVSAYEAFEVGRGLRACPAPGHLKSWDEVAGELLHLMLKAE